MSLVYHRHMNVAFMVYGYGLRNKWVYEYEQSQNMNKCKILIKSMSQNLNANCTIFVMQVVDFKRLKMRWRLAAKCWYVQGWWEIVEKYGIFWEIVGNCGRRWKAFGDVNVVDLEKAVDSSTLSY